MKPLPTALLLAALCAGCTTVSLERNTLLQSRTITCVRYQEALDNLAAIAWNRAYLPAYSSIYAGTTRVSDTGQFSSATIWDRAGFASQAINPQLSRNLIENWTLDPVMAPEKLAAIRASCQWVLYGPQCLPPEAMSLLRSVDQDHGPGPHFGVADMLARLPPCWLHVGTRKQVPHRACYKAGYRGTWVWVTAEGLQGLSDFTLVLQDIARASLEDPGLYSLPDYRFLTTTFDRGHGSTVKVTVTVDDKGHLLTGAGKAPTFVPRRRDGEGADAFLRSLITSTSVR